MNLGDCADVFRIPMVSDMPIVSAIRSMLVVRVRMSLAGFWFLMLCILSLGQLFFGMSYVVIGFGVFQKVCFIY